MGKHGFSSVKLRDDLIHVIDKTVAETRDELGLTRFRSRAHFVATACKQLLKELGKDVEEP